MKKLLLLFTILAISLQSYSQYNNKHGYVITAEDTLIAKDQAVLNNTIILKNIGSPEYFPGFLGSGWKINTDSAKMVLDYLTVRKSMRVYELLISKLRAVNGGLVISSANAKIDKVTTIGDEYHIYPQDTLLTFYNYDIARCQVFANPNLRYYQLEIDSLAVDCNSFYAHRIDGEDSPQADDELVQFGNTQNTARQGLLYMTANDDGSPFISVLDSVNSTNYTGKTKVRLGNLTGITSLTWGELTGYGLYSGNCYLENGYFSGEIHAISGNVITDSTYISNRNADQDTLTAIKERTSSSFTKTNDEIATRVEKTTYTTDQTIVNGKLTTINSNIQTNWTGINQNAGSISANASSISNINGTVTSNSSNLSLYANKLIAGFSVMGVGGYKTGRTEFDVNGLTIYNDNNVAVFSQDAATGDLSITGKITASFGKIGMFEIGADGNLSATLPVSYTGSSAAIQYQNSDGTHIARIGANAYPSSSTQAVAYFKNNQASMYTKYALYAEAKHDAVDETYAGCFNGNLKVENGCFITTPYTFSISSTSPYVLHTTSSLAVLTNSVADANIYNINIHTPAGNFVPVDGQCLTIINATGNIIKLDTKNKTSLSNIAAYDDHDQFTIRHNANVVLSYYGGCWYCPMDGGN